MIGVALFLSAGAGQIDLYACLHTPGHIQDQAENIEAADWDVGENREIDIRQNEFLPALLRIFRENTSSSKTGTMWTSFLPLRDF